MVIEKKYYDIAQRELEEMQREINAEKAQMSEEEILEDKKWHDEQLETIIKKAEAHMRCFKKVPDPQKVVKFTFLQKDALEIARNMQMNIKTERKEDDLWGTIEMSFNNMWFLDSAPSEWKDIWNINYNEVFTTIRFNSFNNSFKDGGPTVLKTIPPSILVIEVSDSSFHQTIVSYN